MGQDGARAVLAAQIDAIEESYEYFLAYAAQGLRSPSEGSNLEGQLRRKLEAMLEAAEGLESSFEGVLAEVPSGAREGLEGFHRVVVADAVRAVSVIRAVASRPFASSQLVDNLNASVHVRTLLTDLFLLDEILTLGVDAATEPEASVTP